MLESQVAQKSVGAPGDRVLVLGLGVFGQEPSRTTKDKPWFGFQHPSCCILSHINSYKFPKTLDRSYNLNTPALPRRTMGHSIPDPVGAAWLCIRTRLHFPGLPSPAQPGMLYCSVRGGALPQRSRWSKFRRRAAQRCAGEQGYSSVPSPPPPPPLNPKP